MPEKKKPKPKPKLNPDLSQKERFMEYARKVEANESEDEFPETLKRLIRPTR